MAMERIAIMGAGSLGTILGAYISKKRQVDLIDAYQEHVDALNEKGAQVVGNAEFTVPVTAITPAQLTGEYDLIIYMTKQTQNHTALPQIIKHLKPGGIICTAQNGLPEPAICEYIPKEQVYGMPVNWGATFMGPGVSKLTSKVTSLDFTLGAATGEMTPQLKEIQEILECMCPVHPSDNLLGIRWCKLVLNAVNSGLSTVCGATFGDVLTHPVGRVIGAYIGRECIRACAASGEKMAPFGTTDFNELFNFEGIEGAEAAAATWAELLTPHYALEASMLQDLRKGNKCEIDAINGVVSDAGKKYGVDTPFCDTVVRIVKEIEAGTRSMSMDNLKEFNI